MATSKGLNFLLLVVILILAANACLGISDGGWWDCAHHRGYCRETCFPQEKSLGSLGCNEGLVCCVPGV